MNIQVEDLREGKGLKRTVTRKDAEKVWEQVTSALALHQLTKHKLRTTLVPG